METHAVNTLRDVIVIGGSQGAVSVLRTLLSQLPSDFPAAILILIHSSATHHGHLASILARYSALPLDYTVEGEAVLPGKVYLAPPGRGIQIVDPGVIQIIDSPTNLDAPPAADPLFTTAAQVFKHRVIGMVLSGGDTDGTEGANAITAAGGRVLVQEPAEAVIPSMPLHALHHDHPDAVFSIEDVTAVLRRAVFGDESSPGG